MDAALEARRSRDGSESVFLLQICGISAGFVNTGLAETRTDK